MTMPLVPADVDLRGMPWMPLDTARLIDSDLFALSTGDEFKAAVALWCKSWAQVPAASLPSDDRILAHLSGAGARWKKVRAMALRGWIACDDGRLYHAVLAEKAMEAWEQREQFQDRQDNEKTRLQNFRAEHKTLRAMLRKHGIVLPFDTKIDVLRKRVDAITETEPETKPETKTFQDGNACNAHAMAKTGTGTGIYQEQEPTSPHTTARPSRAGALDAPGSGVCGSPPADSARPDDDGVLTVTPATPVPTMPPDAVAASIALRRRGLRITPQHPDLLAAVAEGVTVAGLDAMAETYPDKPAGYVIAACRRQLAEGASPMARASPSTPSIATNNPSKTLRGLQSLQELTTHGTPRLEARCDSPRLGQAHDAEPRTNPGDGCDPRHSRDVA